MGNIGSMGCTRSASVSLALCLVACGQGETPIAGGACTTNKDCVADEICIGGTCTAAGVMGCQDETDCPPDQFCERASGECKPEETVGCTGDDVCPAHQRCNTTSGVCIDGPRRCTAEASCAAIGQHCDTMIGQCRECLSTAQCPTNRVCDNGACVMGTMNPNACTADFSCMPPSTICEASACVPGCGTAGCPMGQSCNASTGRCVAAQGGCMADTECGAPARVCEASACVPGCAQPGGLACAGGTVCDTGTGRCVQVQGRCTSDAQCSAPSTVCESSQCVPGCGQPGGLQCTGGTVCDTGTGRCVQVQGPCATDASCGPPNQICETGQCVPGCGQIGGVQCTGATQCNAATGRCDPQNPMGCTTDAQCGAPANLCVGGSCAPGCAQAGCPGGQQCNTSTGYCGAQMGGTGLPLDAACAGNTDCASKVCFDFGAGVGGRCVSSCGTGRDCPSGFTCYDNLGAHMCVSASLFQGASFTTPVGGSCAGPADCQSGFCDEGPPRVCRAQCTEDAQCGAQACRWQEFTQDIYAGLCGPRSGVANGGPCSVGSDCASGVCFQNTCNALCSSSADCAQGTSCALFNDSVCVLGGLITCFAWEPNFVKACAPGLHGQGPVGAACSGYQECRSGLCHTGLAQCTDTCAVDSDCPATHRCKVLQYGQLSDGTSVYLNVCLPEGA